MATGSSEFHEAPDVLQPATLDRHRGIVSLQEELEAVDWYDQRIDATTDDELREILRHNRDEEKEHAAMLLEWVRRRDPMLGENLSRYLFTQGPIHERAEVADAGVAPGRRADLGIGAIDGKEVL